MWTVVVSVETIGACIWTLVARACVSIEVTSGLQVDLLKCVFFIRHYPHRRPQQLVEIMMKIKSAKCESDSPMKGSVAYDL